MQTSKPLALSRSAKRALVRLSPGHKRRPKGVRATVAASLVTAGLAYRRQECLQRSAGGDTMAKALREEQEARVRLRDFRA